MLPKATHVLKDALDAPRAQDAIPMLAAGAMPNTTILTVFAAPARAVVERAPRRSIRRAGLRRLLHGLRV